MIILGIILALLGWFFAVSIIMYIGIILIIVGAVLMATGRPVIGGRSRWY